VTPALAQTINIYLIIVLLVTKNKYILELNIILRVGTAKIVYYFQGWQELLRAPRLIYSRSPLLALIWPRLTTGSLGRMGPGALALPVPPSPRP
jgi:hypothetical protein